LYPDLLLRVDQFQDNSFVQRHRIAQRQKRGFPQFVAELGVGDEYETFHLRVKETFLPEDSGGLLGGLAAVVEGGLAEILLLDKLVPKDGGQFKIKINLRLKLALQLSQQESSNLFLPINPLDSPKTR
jgi:hypothetical protein